MKSDAPESENAPEPDLSPSADNPAVPDGKAGKRAKDYHGIRPPRGLKSPPKYPWHRQPGEDKWIYTKFEVFLNMPKEQRTIKAAADLCGSKHSTLAQLASRHFWLERARCYDNHIAEVEQKARDAETARHAKLWQRRRLEAIEYRYELGGKLYEKVEQMLAMPLTTKTVKERDAQGNAVRIDIKPARWGFGNIPSATRTAEVLRTTAINEALAEDDSFDPATATPEECKAYLERTREAGRQTQIALDDLDR